ncbi:MAG TPA: Hsp70 family protein, partial [Methanothermobacter thermautotrophicus]|nr:Hsp70 family protein [Methanothermobacter thermautotrophicus]
GERPMAADNTSLGRFQLVGIPPAPRGVPQIEVTFDIDANGILNVSAKDLGTGKEQAITITAPNKLSEEEIKQKIEEAKKHAEEDRRKQEEIEIRNNADSMIYTAEKTLDELGDKVPAEKKEEVEKQVSELRELIAGDDIQAIKSKTEELTKTVQEIGAVIYQQAAQQQTDSTASTGENQGGDDTIDADFEVKN